MSCPRCDALALEVEAQARQVYIAKMALAAAFERLSSVGSPGRPDQQAAIKRALDTLRNGLTVLQALPRT